MSYKFIRIGPAVVPNTVLRLADGAQIPTNDPENVDCAAHLAWLAAGNVTQPADAPVGQLSQAEITRLAGIDAAITADTTLQTLMGMTSAELDTWWAANVTTAAQLINLSRRHLKLTLRIAKRIGM